METHVDQCKTKDKYSEWSAVYKCRLCDKVYQGVSTKNQITSMNCAALTCEDPLAPPSAMDVHICKDGSYGVSDFQGMKKTK